MKKEILLDKLRRNTKEQYDMPDMQIDATIYEDTYQVFLDICDTVGAQVIENVSYKEIDKIIKSVYPNAKNITSHLPYVSSTINPDTVDDAKDLNGTDVGVVEGEIGVAENGCIWVPQTMKERAVMFISENLVIVLRKSGIVNNMHEAYSRIRMTDYGYGCFISGPSKTADIEQALVMGAQAACNVTVVLIED